jgi:Transposase DDE domain group 1
MCESSISINYAMTAKLDNVSQHGLLASLYQFAQKKGFFQRWEELPFKMKSVRYSPADKLKTLWASIVVGCQHTFDINIKLGAQEKMLASLFGLFRFPDQSQVNRLLRRSTEEVLDCYRLFHFDLLCRMTRSRKRSLWLPLANGERLLVADLDQRGIVVSGKQFELAEKGYFGRHRGHKGYQLSVLFLGGEVGEVLDEHLDPGNVYVKSRVPELLDSLQEFCCRKKISPGRILFRGDAELGTPAVIAMVERYGFKYLLKGLSPQRARKLAEEVEDYYQPVKPGADDQKRWMADLGERTHYDRSESGEGKSIVCRTLMMVCVREAPEPAEETKKAGKRPHRRRKKAENEQIEQPRIRHDCFLTNLSKEELPVEKVLEVYDSRTTIESYFSDEQYALGAKHVRTWRYYGSALFQYLVATTNNLLRWYKHEVLKGTEFEDYGLKRIINQLMQIPARLIKRGRAWSIEFPQRHALAVKLLNQLHIHSP